MKKIVFIGVGLGTDKPAGIHRNTLELLKELDSTEIATNCVIAIPPSEEIKYKFKNIKIKKIGRSISNYSGKLHYISRIQMFLWKNITLFHYIKKEKAVSVDMLLVFPLKCSDIVMVYDCIPERLPQFYSSKEKKKKRKKLISHQKRALRGSRIVLTDSYHAKNDISDFYGVPQNKIKVLYCAWQHFNSIKEDEKILEKLNLAPHRYFFSLGSRFPHKNIKWVTCAAKQNPDYIFVVSGQKSSFKDTSFEGDIPSNMIFCGYLEDSEVKSLMKNCLAFIQPSIYEGFGLPPMEAMSVGANCIVSNRTALPEIYKKSVWYINPDEYDNINMSRIMSQDKESNEIVLDQYSWNNSARVFQDIVKHIV
ncbi:Glycosyltransferase involved in cell wall bisynthesis [Lachnospiraceae bacterium NE2001]|nr:Glycosyltransferase involved in cell wall bisynthesis [Lachnospiraceae bacterium NE2001]